MKPINKEKIKKIKELVNGLNPEEVVDKDKLKQKAAEEKEHLNEILKKDE